MHMCICVCVYVCVNVCVYVYVYTCVCVYMCVHACLCMCECVFLCKCVHMEFMFRFIVDRITRSSSIKMVVLSRIQYNDKEVKNSTIGCMLFLYH